MARKSRKENIAMAAATEEAETQVVEATYFVGLYARKSVVEDADDTDSIHTQIAMLERYAECQTDMRIYDVYEDAGETGTKFDRPEFNRLMDDIRSGRVNCVIVKDLSRFGRNYLEAGTLLETIFPYMGVRFISLNEHYDSKDVSAQENSLAISVENLLNDLYARDISKKINSVYLENFKQGNYMGPCAPYGYVCSPEDHHRFIVDPEAAAVVKTIFQMKAEGANYQKIANYLNISGKENPVCYKYRKGILKSDKYAKDKPWNPNTIKKILCNQAYIGNIVQGKQQRRNTTQRKMISVQASEWFVSENMHEAIIDRELWYKVQSILQATTDQYMNRLKKYDNRLQTENILLRKLICTECGKYLHRGHQYAKEHITYNYACVTTHKDGTICKSRYHNEQKLFEIIFEAIKQQIKLALDTKKMLVELSKMDSFHAAAEKIQRELTQTENRLKATRSRKTTLYSSYSDGTVSLNDYNCMCKQYDKEIQDLTEQVENLTVALYKEKNMKSTKNKWIVEFERFKRQKKLTKDMVDALIDKIYVHGQYELEIVFKFRDEYLYLMREIEKAQVETA